MRLAIYPGSFDPPTLGHLDVIQRASKLFDRLIISVGVNSSKKPLMPASSRVEALQQMVRGMANVSVDQFEGLLIEHARTVGATSIIRGLRATADFEYEFQMAMVNRRLDDSIETQFLMTKWEHSYLSSSIVREVASLGGDFRPLVPSEIVPYIERALRG